MNRMKLIPVVVLVSLLFTSVAAAAPAQADGGYYYTVRPGETLFSIGRVTGVNPWTIARVNGLANPHRIYAGQVLWIPGAYVPPVCNTYRTVYAGETLRSISRATGISAWAIAAANGIYNMNRIYAGQSLWIPCP
ncbi:MAG TPA: LysM peptidoglycan-binding domain-containing protein [Anaerolineae bacterium]|nr:LysM peptidoglycan-binding domain-containing protein [Anaerolineae bacterium]